MRLRQYFDQEPSEPAPKRGSSKPRRKSIATHNSFLPMLTAWGAALGGLAVIVLPESTIARTSMLFGLDSIGSGAKYVLAAVAALLGGGTAFVVASAWRERARRAAEQVSVVSAVNTTRRVRPIDPAAELGSDSLDAPIESQPFSGELGDESPQDAESFDTEFAERLDVSLGDSSVDHEWIEAETAEPDPDAKPQPTLGELSRRGYDIEEPVDSTADDEDEPAEKPSFTRSHFKTALIESCEGATCEAAPQPDISLVEPEVEMPKPQALDLSEFAEMPGRNAVWVEEKPESVAPEPVVKAEPAPAPPPASALEKLRQSPPEDLSLVQMVERFAGALHEHQEAERARQVKAGPQSGPQRDAALAEALKALTLFTERGFDQADPAEANASFAPSATPSNEGQLGQTERELREALVKLQSLRGAA